MGYSEQYFTATENTLRIVTFDTFLDFETQEQVTEAIAIVFERVQ